MLPPYNLEIISHLLKRKYNTTPKLDDTPSTKLTTHGSDILLGNYINVYSLIGAEFTPELIGAYPEAKDIPSTSRDLNA